MNYLISTKNLTVKHWPKGERPREKLLSKGPESLSDAELLSIFLRVGIQGKSVIDLSRELLHQYGSLKAILSSDMKQFCKIKGLGKTKYCELRAILEMSRRYLFETIKQQHPLKNATQTKKYLISKLSDSEREIFGCVFLDSSHRIICFKELFQGSIDQLHVHPREMIKEALKLNAAALILAHNHPSGNVKPSDQDIQFTKKLKSLCSQMDIIILDHIIVGRSAAVSLVEQGMI